MAKIGPSLGELWKRGIAELQNITIAFPPPLPTSPHIDMDRG